MRGWKLGMIFGNVKPKSGLRHSPRYEGMETEVPPDQPRPTNPSETLAPL